MRYQLPSQPTHDITWFPRGIHHDGIIPRLLKRSELRLEQVRIHEMSGSLPEPALDQSRFDLEIHKHDPVGDAQMPTIRSLQG